MSERKIDSLEFGSNLENGAAWLHRIFSAVIKDDISLRAQMPTSGIPGQQITVEITGGDCKYSQTSAMLTDWTGAVMAYGKIGEPGNGPKTFTIPENIAPAEYNLIVFGEQVNRGRSIDYITNVVTSKISLSESVDIPEEPEPDYPDVEVMDISGLNIARAPESGELIQQGVKDGIVDIVLIANEGYFFPDEYGSNFDAAMLSGLSIVTQGDNMLTITGKPTESTQIRLVPAVSRFFDFSEKPEHHQEPELPGDLVSEEHAIDDEIVIEDEIGFEDEITVENDIATEDKIVIEDEIAVESDIAIEDEIGFEDEIAVENEIAIEDEIAVENEIVIEDEIDIGVNGASDESNKTLIFLPDEDDDAGELDHLLNQDDDHGHSYGHTSSHFNPDDKEEYVVADTYEVTGIPEDDDAPTSDKEVDCHEDVKEPDSHEGKSDTMGLPAPIKYLVVTIISVALISYWQLKRRLK